MEDLNALSGYGLGLAKYHAVIVCDEKLVRVFGEETNFFMVTEATTIHEKCGRQVGRRSQLEEVPIVQDFPEVFPEDLPGIPPTRQWEFQNDLITVVLSASSTVTLSTGSIRR
ncbi:hypothetical protein Tco_1218032 [Tanacetum coccineum]|uniref:Uncharacterized protein n=1 Tax=Tanacetum coccineum TaxID=301880 RepID=A0ABQ5HN08_9ASTR